MKQYIYYQINGGTVISDNIILSDTLGIGDTLWITFTDPYNFSIAGTYTYLFYQSFNNDNNTANDTVSGYFLVDVCTGIEDNLLQNIAVYPNPNNGKFIIELPEISQTKIKIEIVSLTGQIVAEVLTNNIRNEFDISEFGKGIYFVRITENKFSYIKKIVIE